MEQAAPTAAEVRVRPVVSEAFPNVPDGPGIPLSHLGVALTHFVDLQIFDVNVRPHIRSPNCEDPAAARMTSGGRSLCSLTRTRGMVEPSMTAVPDATKALVCTPASVPGLDHEVEVGCLGHTGLAEAGMGEDLDDALRTSLSAEGHSSRL